MLRKVTSLFIAFLLCFAFLAPSAMAADKATNDVNHAEQYIDQALQSAKQGNLQDANNYYKQFRDTWLTIEDGVKNDSSTAYTDIESNMGQVEYALIQNNSKSVIQALQDLKQVNEKFINGQYGKGESFKKENISLTDFIGMLKQTKQQVDANQIQNAQSGITNVRKSWLSVEGVVVAQSASVYNDAERDMVTVNAMLTSQPANVQGASQLLQTMINYLSPLSEKSSYTMWDAAMIPIREGLEALLVVAALLAFVNKSKNKQGKTWIWGGVLAGLLLSIVLAVIVKLVFSSATFGNNNSLISGWTGVIAAVMLLYMSYWLHRQSSIKDWNRYIREKSETAISTGKLASFGFLAFLAIFREGTETVLFLIGMVNQISMRNLIIGLLLGLGVLVVLAFLMLFVGFKLPMRPFFMISSLIVFYLCLKFTGMGLHSLQLAGTIPSSTSPSLPTLDFIALYPSWESTIPQILLVLIALAVIVGKRVSVKKKELQ